MKRRHMYIVFSMLLVVATIGALTACSSTRPIATKPPLYTQEKLEAVDHWDNLANQVAERVKKSISERRDLINKPLYVQPSGDRPFALAFHELLSTRLVSKGLQVSHRPESDTITLTSTVQMVLHESRASWVPSLAGLGIGVLNLVTGSYTTRSRHEIIVNTDMMYKNRYVLHLSSVHYIDDDEWEMYLGPESFDPNGGKNRTVRLVSR